MKVIGINGSARKDGNTALLINTVFDELSKNGIETELIQFSGEVIKPCRACFACGGRGNCVYSDDIFSEIFEKCVGADGIILGSPVYSADVSSNMKAFIDRASVVAATNSGIFKHKIAASVAAVRRGGGMTAIDTMNRFFLNKEMLVIGSIYWNMVYGKDIGEVMNDSEGIMNMKNLGQNMAWALKNYSGKAE